MIYGIPSSEITVSMYKYVYNIIAASSCDIHVSTLVAEGRIH